MSTWKQFERDVATMLNTRRNPLSGPGNVDDDGRPRTGDIIHPMLEVKCKLRARIAVFNWWRQLEQDAAASGKTPALFLREKGNRQRVLVVIDSAYFVRLLQGDERLAVPVATPRDEGPPEPQRKRIPQRELRSGPGRRKRQCNLCRREVFLTKYERFCTPCKEDAQSLSRVRKGRLGLR